MQVGASGIHSDVSVHVRCVDLDRLNPRSHVYAADANRVLLPCIPADKYNIPFLGGKRFPQSIEAIPNIFVLYCKHYIAWCITFLICLLELQIKSKVDTSLLQNLEDLTV